MSEHVRNIYRQFWLIIHSEGGEKIRTAIQTSYARFNILFWCIVTIPSLVLIAQDIVFAFRPELDIDLALACAILFIGWLLLFGICSLIVLIRRFPQRFAKLTWGFALSLLCLWPTHLLLSYYPIGAACRLAFFYPEYMKTIQTDPHKCHVFDWGGFGFLSDFEQSLIYDPNDRVPQENTVDTNQHRHKAPSKTIRHLFGHFYLLVTCNTC